jgi:endonuclease/exonuclease/phosphatase family metal-dependent hydrolase
MVEIKILTQNTQLLPGGKLLMNITGQCKAKDERIPCIMDQINTYHIVGLQEVFDENCQNKIIRAWHTRHSLGTVRVNLDELILAQKQKVASGGQAIIDAHPNEIDAYIVYDKHFVMGPDSDLSVDYSVVKMLGLPRQDGGLVILTNVDYPIIAASGFVFSDTAKIRITNNWDAASNKGALYARVQVGTSRENYIHVFTTHLQAHECKECPNVRVKQLDELKKFIENATNKDGHPVVLLGDFNIIAERYLFSGDDFSRKDGEKLKRFLRDDCGVNWAKEENAVETISHLYKSKDQGDSFFIVFKDGKSVEIKRDKKMEKGILTVNLLTYEDGKPQYTTDKTHNLRVRTENDNLNTYAYTPEYEQLLKELPQHLVDVWKEMKPSQSGHTWIGEKQKTKKDSPWGELGNVLAGEDEEPQRIDFFFYNKGSGKLTLNPKNISLVPSGPPQTLYCFDDEARVYLGFCLSDKLREKLTDKVLNPNDWPSAWKESDTNQLRLELGKQGFTLCEEASIKFMREAGGYEVGIIDYCKEGEKLILRNQRRGPIGKDRKLGLYVYKEISTSHKCVRIFEKERCELKSHTVSDHLGVEMTCDLVPDSRIKRIEVPFDPEWNGSEWRIESADWPTGSN